MKKKFYFLPNLNKSVLEKINEEDRRFLMSELLQNIKSLDNIKQFRLNFSVSWAAIYISIISIMIVSNQSDSLLLGVSVIFMILFLYIHHYKKRQEKELIELYTIAYNKLQEFHFRYVKNNK